MPYNAVERYNQYDRQPNSLYNFTSGIDNFLNKVQSSPVTKPIKVAGGAIVGMTGLNQPYNLGRNIVRVGADLSGAQSYGGEGLGTDLRNLGINAVLTAMYGKGINTAMNTSFANRVASQNLLNRGVLNEADTNLLNKYIKNSSFIKNYMSGGLNKLMTAFGGYLGGKESLDAMNKPHNPNIPLTAGDTLTNTTGNSNNQGLTKADILNIIAKGYGLNKQFLSKGDVAELGAAANAAKVNYLNQLAGVKFGIGTTQAENARNLGDINREYTGTYMDTLGTLADLGQGFSPAQAGGLQQSMEGRRDLALANQRLQTGNTIADYLLKGTQLGNEYKSKLGEVSASGSKTGYENFQKYFGPGTDFAQYAAYLDKYGPEEAAKRYPQYMTGGM